MRIERDPQPVPGGDTITVDREWFDAAMRVGVPFDSVPTGCVRVTIEDEDGETETAIVGPHDYTLICVDDCHLSGTQAHANGTHVLTVKGRRR